MQTNKTQIPEIATTAEAAKILNRKPQTLFTWSCYESGPIKPVRINGRLGWRIDDIKSLINGELE